MFSISYLEDQESYLEKNNFFFNRIRNRNNLYYGISR